MHLEVLIPWLARVRLRDLVVQVRQCLRRGGGHVAGDRLMHELNLQRRLQCRGTNVSKHDHMILRQGGHLYKR